MSQTIQVSLPSSTLYVSGTVNGAASTWTNTSGQIWETTAARAENEIYYVELTIVNSLGTTTEKSITLYYGLLNLITDRTQADVDYVTRLALKGQSGTLTDEEQAAFLAGLKGAYNAADLNRVESATEYVNTFLNGLQAALDTFRAQYGVAMDAFWAVPYAPLDLTHKTDWAISDLPTVSDLARYLENVRKVAGQVAIDHALPGSMDGLNYGGANEIERALIAEYDAAQAFETEKKQLIVNTALSFIQSGEIYGGEF